jgi:hypothetical protein
MDVKIKYKKPDIAVVEKKWKLITIVEIGVTSKDNLHQVESETYRKYDFLANELSLTYGYRTKIIPYVLNRDCKVTKFHRQHAGELEIPSNIEAYILKILLKRH